MGRQSHLARLALGRSPFDPPLVDERDHFILGPNVQHDTARDYVQHFDSRGHPQHSASEHSQRRLIRAQNDALATVGVVVRKANLGRNRWQTMADERKHSLLLDENVAGANCGMIEDLLQRLTLRWIVSFRRRLLTYKSYLGLPVLTMMRSEWKIVGARAFLFPGYPLAAMASLSQSLREYILNTRAVSDPLRPTGLFSLRRGLNFLWVQSLKLAWFAVEYPLYATSVLQSLHLLPQDMMPPLSTLLPFTIDPPSIFSRDHQTLSGSILLSDARNFLFHPFVLSYVRDMCGQYFFSSIYVLVRQFVRKPDRPDRLSLRSFQNKTQTTNEVSLTLVPRNKTRQQHLGRQTLTETLRKMFPSVFRLWERILQTRRAPLPVELSPDIEDDLIQRSSLYYQELLRRNRELSPELRRPARTLRMIAIRSAFNDYNLDPEHGLLEVEWADDLSSVASTSTPDQQDLFSPDQVLEGPTDQQFEDTRADDAVSLLLEDVPAIPALQQGPNEHLADLQIIDDIGSPEIPQRLTFEPTIPLDTLLEAAPAGEVAQEDPNVRQPTPVPGLSRAPSLLPAAPRPVRRPTDLGTNPRPSREELIRHERPPEELRSGDDSHYRVTILSNHPAETLSLGIASIATTVVMLPLDIIFMRSLARNFLLSRLGDHRGSMQDPSLADVWPIVTGTGIAGPEFRQFWGNWLLTLGIQGAISFVTWTASTHSILHISRKFGWGQF